MCILCNVCHLDHVHAGVSKEAWSAVSPSQQEIQSYRKTMAVVLGIVHCSLCYGLLLCCSRCRSILLAQCAFCHQCFLLVSNGSWSACMCMGECQALVRSILYAVFDADNDRGSWQERQLYDIDPFMYKNHDRRSQFEFYSPLVFYLFAWLVSVTEMFRVTADVR